MQDISWGANYYQLADQQNTHAVYFLSFPAPKDGDSSHYNGGGVHNGNGASDWAGYATNMYLLQVHGTTEHNTKAVQVPFTAASLNSGDVFLLFSGSTVYLWAGRKSTGDEREMAKKIATKSERQGIWSPFLERVRPRALAVNAISM